MAQETPKSGLATGQSISSGTFAGPVTSATCGSVGGGGSFNSDNRIPAGQLPPHQRLVHLASLHRLLTRTLAGGTTSFPLHRFLDEVTEGHIRLVSSSLSAAELDPLVAALRNRGEEAVREMAGLICDTLGPNEPAWWASFAAEITSYLQSEDWSEACRLTGLGHLSEGDWLLAWEYPLDLPGPLYRPTVVEASNSPYHYPSPPNYAYGITMALDSRLPAVREVVHAPLKGQAAIDGSNGRVGRLFSLFITADDIPRLRAQHCDQLRLQYTGPPSQGWLQRHRKGP